ncbi:MAG: winged helix-turn-helix transcriptional regulator [Gammaproteobacteria bacterium]|nr:winged helix-turn-helix transcriptional regulator [Gammaproteobacteria bacterium]
MSDWTLFSNHGHVLVCLVRNSEARLRDVAMDVGITERAVQKIVRDLQDGGMVTVTKNGRRNSYRIHGKKTLRHDLESTCTLKDLVRFVNKDISKKPLPGKVESQVTEKVPASPLLVKKKPIQSPVAVIEKERVEPAEAETDNSGQPENKEKQQGFLF